ncbi:MAG: hypothetical protein KGD73_07585 [Candidatus Lokiarchaeota archaeon]|nr:hypothetical protein [Candidatus Lokiarchaeota archaeon]
MVLFQLTPMRIITIYVAQGVIFAFFLFLAIKILKRDRKRLNVIFAGFYISPVFGMFVNFIYGPMTDVNLVLVLNFVTNFGIFYSPIFLVVFDLILLKSEKVITTTKQTLIFLAYGIALFSMVFFLFIPGAGVTLNANWSPVWSLPFFIYVISVVSIGAVIPFLYLSLQIYKKFEDDILKKKWKFFIYGFFCLLVFLYGIFISNTLNIDIFRTLLGLVGLILAIIAGYLMYSGVGRQLEK